MFHSILVPLDGSTFAEQALAPAAKVAHRHGALLSLAIVHPWGPAEDAPFSGTKLDREFREAEGVYLNRMVQTVTSTYRVAACEAILEGEAGPALVEFARRRHIDLVVASTHGRSIVGRFVLGGSVAYYLVHALRASILLIKPQKTPVGTLSDGFERILLATGDSPKAEIALGPAAALAASASGTITLYRVVPPIASSGQTLDERRAEAEDQLTALVPQLTARGVDADTVVAVAANPASAILAQAERSNADLIVLITRERSTLARALFGSVDDAVLHHASVPVLVCHAGG